MLCYTCCLAFSNFDNHFGRSTFGSTMGCWQVRKGSVEKWRFSRKLNGDLDLGNYRGKLGRAYFRRFSFTVCIYLLEGCYFHNVNEQCNRDLLYIKKRSLGF